MFKTAGSLSDIKVTFDLRDEDDIGDDDEVASVSKTYYTNLLSFYLLVFTRQNWLDFQL